MHGANMLLEAKHWLQQAFPHWNRTEGRDHIWLMTHDEGSCWLPGELRNSIVLSHWGRKVSSCLNTLLSSCLACSNAVSDSQALDSACNKATQ